MANANVAAVEAAVEGFRKAMISGDRAALANCAWDELVYRHSTGRTENKQQFVDGAAGAAPKISDAKIRDLKTTVVDNVAVVDFTFERVRRAPAEGSSVMTVLSVWMQRDGQWKMVARHSAK